MSFRPIPGKISGYRINRYGLVKNEKGRLLKPQIRHGMCYYQLHRGEKAFSKTAKTLAEQAKIKLITDPNKSQENIIKFVAQYNQLLKERKAKKKLESFHYIEPENRPNGKNCVDCGKDLWGGWFRRCPPCWDKMDLREEEENE